MNSIRLLLFIIIGLYLSNCQKGTSKKLDSKIDNIGFYYKSGLRIPFHSVSVNILRFEHAEKAIAFIRCEPSSNDPEWNYSKIDTTIELDIASFEKLANATGTLENINLDKASVSGLDGSTWKIEFGSKGKNISYSFWSPTSDSTERGLTGFVNLSKQILDKVNLNKKQILED